MTWTVECPPESFSIPLLDFIAFLFRLPLVDAAKCLDSITTGSPNGNRVKAIWVVYWQDNIAVFNLVALHSEMKHLLRLDRRKMSHLSTF